MKTKEHEHIQDGDVVYKKEGEETPTKRDTHYAKCQTPGCRVEYYIGGYMTDEPVPPCPECKGEGKVVYENIWPKKRRRI